MKKNIFLLLAAIMLLLMSGCQKTEDTDQSKNSGQETKPQAQELISDLYQGIPVISITTKSQDKKVMDFVTKPVAEHVAKMIASWTPDYKFPPAPYYEDCFITVKNEKDQLTLTNVSGQVKVRGNWTTNYDKKSLRIKFDEKQTMLGLNESAQMKNWILLAEYKDASMLRNKVSFYMSREILGTDGYYAADCKLVEVLINGEYWGLYLLTEMQQVQENRVAITEVQENDTSTAIGYFLEMDGYYYNEDPLKQFFVDYHNNAALTPYDGAGGSGKQITCLKQNSKDNRKDIGFTIKSDIYSQEQHDFIANYVNNVYNIMYEAAYNQKAFVFNENYSAISETTRITPREAVEQVVDVRSLVDSYIVAELTCDADLYWSSFYMDVDFGPEGKKKLTFEAPWDFDSGLGNKKRCVDGTGFYAANAIWDVDDVNYETVNPWLAVLAYEDWFQELIKDRWTAIYDGETFERALSMIDEDKETYQVAFTRNYQKWNNILNNGPFVNELSNKAKSCKTQLAAANYLGNWLRSRVEFLNNEWHRYNYPKTMKNRNRGKEGID